VVHVRVGCGTEIDACGEGSAVVSGIIGVAGRWCW
jgi:hypothetical protein